LLKQTLLHQVCDAIQRHSTLSSHLRAAQVSRLVGTDVSA